MFSVVWFRQDLRTNDNPALSAAAAKGLPLLPIYILDEKTEALGYLGAASKAWLHRSLESLNADLQKKGLHLHFFSGNSEKIIGDLCSLHGAAALYWNRLYELPLRERDEKIKTQWKAKGVEIKSFNSSLLFEPWNIQTKLNRPFQVFSPFYKACLETQIPELPKSISKTLPMARIPKLKSLSLRDLKLLPPIDWDKKIFETQNGWQVGEKAAELQFQKFKNKKLLKYSTDRDLPSKEGTSQLSPHLHFGEISPVRIWKECLKIKKNAIETFKKELAWREFAYHLIYHFPQTARKPLRKEFENFPWRSSPQDLKKWQKGLTGYPIVDAGMRQLWTTGWMHNRVRMIVASFLTKHLLIPWQKGADWFQETLVDADLANNSLGWQWTSGSGADAAPYFRIFNPTLQSQKFDPDGLYIKHWVPELSHLSADSIHEPWNLDNPPLNYPKPIVEHSFARKRALEAFAAIRK